MKTSFRVARAIAFAGVLCVGAAACGGDDDASTSAVETVTDSASEPSATATDSATGAGTTPAPGDGPNATVPANLPAELIGEVGPLEVDGTALPVLDQGVSIDDDPALGMTVPVLVGEDYDGNVVRVDPATDGPTVVVFLAHWCPHCNAEVPRINQLRDEGKIPEGVNVVAVSTAIDPSRPNWPPSQWIVDMDWTYPVIADGVDMNAGQFIGATAYGVGGFPFVTLVGADGTVQARWAGEHTPEEFLDLVTTYLT